jgi:hypothetical protein
MEPVPVLLGIHTKPLSKASVAIMDPLFNATGKALLPDAVIVK